MNKIQDLTNELLHIKEVIEDNKEEVAKNEGVKEKLLNELNEKYNCLDIESAKTLLDKLNIQFKDDEKKLINEVEYLINLSNKLQLEEEEL